MTLKEIRERLQKLESQSQDVNVLKIGDVEIVSTQNTLGEVVGFVEVAIKRPAIKKYLEIHRKKKLAGLTG